MEAELRYAVVDNKVKKPGPVFTGITREAFYEAKADYIYRVNDDTELATKSSTAEFTSASHTFERVAPFGETEYAAISWWNLTKILIWIFKALIKYLLRIKTKF